MYEILSIGEYELRVDLEDFDGVKRYAEYSTFNISSEADNYRLTAIGYTGDAGRYNGYVMCILLLHQTALVPH